MSDTSLVLSLPFIQPSQAQKHVTHNDAVEILDVLVQAAAKALLASPPATAGTGERYLVATDATGDWAGQDGAIALYGEAGQGWRFFAPQTGWRVYVEDQAALMLFDGTGWTTPGALPQTVTQLGVATSADTTNRLAVAAAASLFTHAGAGHQIKVNKATAADTASLLFQDNWSGRAEMGLAGNDDFEVKVSADGAAFFTALRAARASGIVTLPQGAVVNGLMSGTAVQGSVIDATPGRLLSVGAFGLGAEAPLIGNAATTAGSIAPGFYAYDSAQGSTGGPAGVTQGLLLHQRSGSTAGEVQLFYTEAGTGGAGALYSRARSTGSWGAWCSGGISAGAQTAQGRYRRHQDGTQTCWQSVTTLTGGELAVTFPAAFASTTDLATTLGVSTATVGAISARFTGRTATGLNLSAFNTSNARVAVSVDIVTVGRWF
ncbi:DUF2793 domain-containing protein [Paenirhodobacter enshiensis]|uniref:DUF2793 domain-containing protein n=1 Tax=Paenirhodobacter enshiensis TaxID=1105367 RepID=UPI0035AE8C2C